MHSQP